MSTAIAKSIDQLGLHPLAAGVMRYYFEGGGASAEPQVDQLFAFLRLAFLRLPSQQVYAAGMDALKVAQALSHVGRALDAEQLANAVREAIERRACHEGRVGAASAQVEQAGEQYAAFSATPIVLPIAKKPAARPRSALGPLAKEGLEDMDLDTLRRMADRAERALAARPASDQSSRSGSTGMGRPRTA